jgi:hypothetical protein
MGDHCLGRVLQMELKDNKIFNRAIIVLAEAMRDLMITSTPVNKEGVWTHTLEVFGLM